MVERSLSGLYNVFSVMGKAYSLNVAHRLFSAKAFPTLRMLGFKVVNGYRCSIHTTIVFSAVVWEFEAAMTQFLMNFRHDRAIAVVLKPPEVIEQLIQHQNHFLEIF
jgi:hypothetical protein